MTKLFFTSRALKDIQKIYEYSYNKWGETTALRYMRHFEETFTLLKENKGLLRTNRKISSKFMVYPIKKHCLICDIINENIFIITVKHVSMNLLERLKKLEPTLDEEIKTLKNRI